MSPTLEHAGSPAFDIPRIGLGCMGMSEFYGTPDDEESLRVLHEAFEIGYRHFDTADMYGKGHNELLLARFLRQLGARRHEVLVATKVGIRRSPQSFIEVDSSAAYIREACEASLKRLDIERIDLLYLHRKSPGIEIEESVGEMAQLVAQGKVAALGLSEVSAATLERACKVAPIAALQSEYSLWTRDVEAAILPLCRRLNVALVAYSPLGRGFLTGELKAAVVSNPDDLRSKLPRFQPQNFEANSALLETLQSVADRHACLPAQIALAWVLGAEPLVRVIPGTRRSHHLKNNFMAGTIALTAQEREQLSSAFAQQAIQGQRYPEALLQTVNV